LAEKLSLLSQLRLGFVTAWLVECAGHYRVVQITLSEWMFAAAATRISVEAVL